MTFIGRPAWHGAARLVNENETEIYVLDMNAMFVQCIPKKSLQGPKKVQAEKEAGTCLADLVTGCHSAHYTLRLYESKGQQFSGCFRLHIMQKWETDKSIIHGTTGRWVS